MSNELCPKCGEQEHWYPTGRVSREDLAIAQDGGPSAPAEMCIKGGHCLSCGHEEQAVYAADPIESNSEKAYAAG